MTVLQIKSLAAAYLETTVDDCIIGGADLLLDAINFARRQAEDLHDFHFAEATATLAITVTGKNLDLAAIGSETPVKLKKIDTVFLPVAGSELQPIEFISKDLWNMRIEAAIGRTSYSSTATLESLGFNQSWATAYQDGRNLYLGPVTMFTFPVTATVDCVRFLPDYTASADTDAFTVNAPDYLVWSAVLEVNKKWKEFVSRQEGNLDEAAIMERKNAALASLIQWDNQAYGGARATRPPQSQPAPTPTPAPAAPSA